MVLRAGTIYPNGELIPVGESARAGSDDLVCRPLWEFSPAERPAVLAERRRRGLLQDDAEPIGDPEYT